MDTAAPTNHAKGANRRERRHIGYASHSKRERRSTLEPQRELLGWEGCQEILNESVRGSDHERFVLARLLGDMEDGDTIAPPKPTAQPGSRRVVPSPVCWPATGSCNGSLRLS